MTYEERVQNIKNEVAKREREEQEKVAKEKAERQGLINSIKELAPRIEMILKLANECEKNGIHIKDYTGYYGNVCEKRPNLISNSIEHFLGLMWPEYGEYEFLGFYNGGACGPYDLYTNGKDVYYIKGTPHMPEKKVEPKMYDLKYFLKEFENFEKEFYNYIDSLGK